MYIHTRCMDIQAALEVMATSDSWVSGKALWRTSLHMCHRLCGRLSTVHGGSTATID